MRERLWLLLGAAIGAVAGAIVTVAVTAAEGSVRPWLMVIIGAAGGVLASSAMIVWTRTALSRTVEPRSAQPAFTNDLQRGGLGQAQWRLDRAVRDPDRFEMIVRRPLSDIAKYRLRVRHGVDSDRDPQRARAMVGDDLWQMMTVPYAARPDLRTALAWVTAVERI